MGNVYEMIHYEGMNFKIAMNELTYVRPHVHREIEFGLVLEGVMQLSAGGERHEIRPGEFWLLNPCQHHEVTTPGVHQPYVFLELQISTSFFKQYFAPIDRLRMNRVHLTRQNVGLSQHERMQWLLIESARSLFSGEPLCELKCAGNINHLMQCLLSAVPYEELSDAELQSNDAHMRRIQRIADTIEERCTEKLLLSDLAEQEGLTLSYLSHLFKDNFGMPFQTYLQQTRCRRAAKMLLETAFTPSEISICCGFSALKYMNNGFAQIFGCTPADYRRQFAGTLPGRQQNALVPQESTSGRGSIPHWSKRRSIDYLDRLSFF